MSPESANRIYSCQEAKDIKTEVRLSTGALSYQFNPIVPFYWGIRKFVEFADQAKYDGLEFIPLRGITREILKNPSVIDIYRDKIKTGHVIFNPYATLSSVLRREKDPIHPGQRLAWYNLALADADKGKAVLHKLEQKIPNFAIVNYNYHPKAKDSQDYGEFGIQWVQIHPAFFNDNSTALDLIHLVEQAGGYYKGVVYDSGHRSETTDSGEAPLYDELKTVSKLLKAGVLKEVHLNPFKYSKKHPERPPKNLSRELIGEAINGKSELRELIQLVKSYNPSIPFVVEVLPLNLYKAGLISLPSLFSTRGELLNIHKKIVSFVKKA